MVKLTEILVKVKCCLTNISQNENVDLRSCLESENKQKKRNKLRNGEKKMKNLIKI
jgi:hypothetical protein